MAVNPGAADERNCEEPFTPLRTNQTHAEFSRVLCGYHPHDPCAGRARALAYKGERCIKFESAGGVVDPLVHVSEPSVVLDPLLNLSVRQVSDGNGLMAVEVAALVLGVLPFAVNSASTRPR